MNTLSCGQKCWNWQNILNRIINTDVRFWYIQSLIYSFHGNRLEDIGDMKTQLNCGFSFCFSICYNHRSSTIYTETNDFSFQKIRFKQSILCFCSNNFGMNKFVMKHSWWMNSLQNQFNMRKSIINMYSKNVQRNGSVCVCVFFLENIQHRK